MSNKKQGGIIGRLYRKNPHLFVLTCTFVVLCLIFTIQISTVKLWPGTDDYVFIEMMKPFQNVFEWVSHRFDSWSSRIVPEALLYMLLQVDLIVWKIITILLFVGSSIAAFRIFKLFQKKKSLSHDLVALSLIMLMPVCINIDILRSSLFWVTGSLNYYWPVAFAVIGAYPVVHILVKKSFPNVLTTIASSLFLFLAIFSQEQLSVAIVALLAFSVFYLLREGRRTSGTRKELSYLIVTLLLSIISIIVILMAPGNSIRTESELATWLPDMHKVSILSRANYSLRWLVDSLVNQVGIIMPILWGLQAAQLISSKKDGKLRILKIVSAIILGSAMIVSATKGWPFSAALVDFKASWGITSTRALLLTIPWIVVLITSAIAPLLIYRSDSRRESNRLLSSLSSLAILLSYALAAIMVFSPTMYASGTRVLFVSSIIITVVAGITLAQLQKMTICADERRVALFLLYFVILASTAYCCLSVISMFLNFP